MPLFGLLGTIEKKERMIENYTINLKEKTIYFKSIFCIKNILVCTLLYKLIR
jgi:hypothetical protein